MVDIRGRDFITTQEFTDEELLEILKVAGELKSKYKNGEPHELLKAKTLFMIFYNSSLRTRNSFEAGMTQLGGHAHFLQPGSIYTPALEGDEKAYSTERVSDVARVLDRMGDGISIRIYGNPTGWRYGKGNEIVRNFAHWAKKIPIINMECDMFHPCQAMADIMAMMEHSGNDLSGKSLSGKKFVMSWAYSGSTQKPLSVPQSCILPPSRFGMDVVLAHPKGLELDPKVVEWAKKNANESGGSFEVSNDMDEAFDGADFVYPKSWTSARFMPPITPAPDHDGAKKLFEANKHWICDQAKLDLCNKGVKYMHCLPADRGMEVTNDVIDGPSSIVFDEAENRMHAQKGVMALTM